MGNNDHITLCNVPRVPVVELHAADFIRRDRLPIDGRSLPSQPLARKGNAVISG